MKNTLNVERLDSVSHDLGIEKAVLCYVVCTNRLVNYFDLTKNLLFAFIVSYRLETKLTLIEKQKKYYLQVIKWYLYT